MSKLIYVASPYWHENKDIIENNYRLVSGFVAELCAKGHVAVSVITYGHTILKFADMPDDWEFWCNFCLTVLAKADELVVYKMPGWDVSRGVAGEIAFAQEHNIPITYKEYESETVN